MPRPSPACGESAQAQGLEASGSRGSGEARYGNVVSKSAALIGAPSVNGAVPTGASAGLHSRDPRRAADRDRMAQASHHDAQRDVDDVIAGTAAVREAREVAAATPNVLCCPPASPRSRC